MLDYRNISAQNDHNVLLPLKFLNLSAYDNVGIFLPPQIFQFTLLPLL